MVANHIFHKLVVSARPFMKLASWGFCVLVFDCSGETVSRPDEMACEVPYGSGTEFIVGRSTCEDDAVGAATGVPMEILSTL